MWFYEKLSDHNYNQGRLDRDGDTQSLKRATYLEAKI
jgi:hypothetical protein